MSAFLEGDKLLELRIGFMQSAHEKLDNIEALVLSAEKKQNQETSKAVLKDILSILHSLKGTARSYKFDALAIITHKLEDFITELLNHNKIISSEELSKMLKFTDLLTSYCQQFLAHKSVDDADFQLRFQHLFSVTNLKKESTKRIILSNIKIQVLVVGINKTIMKQVYMGFTDINHDVSFAADPLEAFHRISQEKFDIIISSYVMDPIDGISFSLAVKNQWHEKAPKIVMLCTEKLTIELKHDQALLPDKILIKSLSLPLELNEYLQQEFSIFTKPKIPQAEKPKKMVKSIYFVEDDQNILDLFLMVFTEKKDVVLFNEVTKSDPFDRISQLFPDLIICDIHVPNVDTMRLLLKLKTDESLSHIPVVYFTGDPNQPIASELLRLGALGVLDKTIILTSMFEELEKLGIDLQPNT
jgi:CheY-like chemotaxis protein/HPt (histidine-containing phosphotransfer) domain-containing protein